jgi:benzoyl-CoA reductase/2-hydroxyglutaryl-CoA dehydratase subunit BcrC/BadD/HgdB
VVDRKLQNEALPVNARTEGAIRFILSERNTGKPIVGLYCCFAPRELVWAMGGVPVGLCATSNKPIEAAETVLPSNLCPLIKASFGYILAGTCPFFELSDAIVGETTCDGKKKMFELIRGYKPMHTLELPQMPDEAEAFAHWEAEVGKLRTFLESTFKKTITDEDLENAISFGNRRRRRQLRLCEFNKEEPPPLAASEINRILDTMAAGEGYEKELEQVIARIEARPRTNPPDSSVGAPRVLLTGCPIAGDAAKVIRIIEECGGAVVVHESCSGIKPLVNPIEERTGNPLRAIARRYFSLPCSCMTPNTGRLALLDRLVAEFRPDCVIDVILQACHTYNIESYGVREHVVKKHNLPFLKIETDYSQNDLGQMRTRIEALLEMVESAGPLQVG